MYKHLYLSRRIHYCRRAAACLSAAARYRARLTVVVRFRCEHVAGALSWRTGLEYRTASCCHAEGPAAGRTFPQAEHKHREQGARLTRSARRRFHHEEMELRACVSQPPASR
jgi:hypothetical protein